MFSTISFMSPYERELDREDDAVVRASILALRPSVTWEELSALHCIGQRPVWEVPLDSAHVGVWELEQLDRRGWIEAQEVDLCSAYGDDAQYETRGGWFSPLNIRRGDGRPDWPVIWRGFRWATEKPTGFQFRIWCRIRLSNRGWRVLKLVDPDDAPDVGLFDDAAISLQRLSAHWRQGDAELAHWIQIGMSSASSGYEKVIRDDARAPVRSTICRMRTDLIPQLQFSMDIGMLADIRQVVRMADPDTEIVDPQDGEPSVRWRCVWPQLRIEGQIDELVPLLFAMQAKRSTSDSLQEQANLVSESDGPFDRSTVDAEFRVGSWFEAVTSEVIKAGTLQRAAKSGRLLRSRQIDGVWYHSVDEVACKKPESALKLRRALVDNSSA